MGDPRIGRVVGKYTLVRVVGSGGMATVYEARHRNGNRVAVKMLKAPLGVSAEVRERFLREGYAANKVEHPGAVRILDDDVTSDGAAFLVMELLEGETLDAIAKGRGGKLPVATVLAIGKQLLEVLAAAHDAGVVHRDIKPENVFLLPGGQLKVVDFGIARVLEPHGATATATGRMLGTPAFMPPEQAYGRRDEIDARSDVWAAGATLFTALAGRVVHVAATAEETHIKAATEAAPPLASVLPDVPAEVAAVVDRALQADRAARWPSAREMLAALEAAHEAVFASPAPSRVEIDGLATVVSASPPTPPPARRPVAIVVGTIALALVATYAVAGRMRAPAATSPNVAGEPEATANAPSVAAAALAETAAASVEPIPPAPPRASSAPIAARIPPRPTERVVAPPPPASASSAVCGFDIDEEGRKWPRRCP